MQGKHPLKPPPSDMVAYTLDGRVALIDLPNLPYSKIYKSRRQWRGAVTRDRVLDCYLVLDLHHADETTVSRWWMMPSRSCAIAQALWFARDVKKAA